RPWRRPPPRSSEPARRGRRASDRAVPRQRPDVLVAVAQLAQDLLAVLAQQGRGADAGGRGRELHRVAYREVAPAHRALDLDDHLALEEMRVGQPLPRVEDGPAGHAGAGQDLHDLVLVAARGPGLE